MDNLKRSDVYRIYSCESVNKPIKMPRRYRLSRKERAVEIGVLMICSLTMLLLALCGEYEYERIFGLVGMFLINILGVLV